MSNIGGIEFGNAVGTLGANGGSNMDREVQNSIDVFVSLSRQAQTRCLNDGKEFSVEKFAHKYRVIAMELTRKGDDIRQLTNPSYGSFSGGNDTPGGHLYVTDEGFGNTGDFEALNAMLTVTFKGIAKQQARPKNLIDPSFIPADSTSVPFGATDFRHLRQFSSAKAQILGESFETGGQGKPRMSFDEVRAQVRYLYIPIEVNMIVSGQLAMSGIDQWSSYMETGMEAVDDLENQLVATGSDIHGLYGLLNHPYFSRVYSPASFDATNASPITCIAAIKRVLKSNTTIVADVRGLPNRLTLPLNALDFLEDNVIDTAEKPNLLNRLVADLAARSDKQRITIDGIPELTNLLGAGVSLGLAHRPGAIKRIRPGADVVLPVQRAGMRMSTTIVRAFGGLAIGDYLNAYGVVIPSTYTPN